MKRFILMLVTFLLAIVVSILPWPLPYAYWQPDYVLLAMLLFALYLPDAIPCFLVFFLGIVLDFLTASLLGEHAIALLTIHYLALLLQRRWKHISRFYQLIFIALFLFLYKAIIFWLQGLQMLFPASNGYWLAVPLGFVAWLLLEALWQKMLVKYQLAS